MNTGIAVGGGLGAVALGLGILAYQIGRWKGGDPTPKIHFFMGVVLAALLFLGGGILGAMGGNAALLGQGIGKYALENATGATVPGGKGGVPLTGGEKVAVSGAITGLVVLLFYAGMIKSGRRDLISPLVRGSLTGIWLGTSAGLIGMSMGLIRTSGNSIGQIFVSTM
ncbi:hypothetical protein EST92_28515 [Streptomyces sp. TM32]|uniref:hypothetical protein n=1 Tax=Streptomyces sp. TM32 TaxID=1652669 RepID=UPI00101060D0|nr:hypothetical protein [Streptomyces sp. TM32]RXS66700.1 hypothetical protein EST92_28515 [Streptomyces sp. TM32]